MGAKTWMIVYSDGSAREALSCSPALDRARTTQLAQTLFPKERLKALPDGSLLDASPANNELAVGSFPGVSVVAAAEFGIDHPSKLPERFIAAAGSGAVTLHAMHSVVDWFAFAHWKNGKLVRSLSVSPDSGVLEDIGIKLPFEEPFWSGQRPAVSDEEEDDYPLPFHPLELGETALADFFGYQLEGAAGDATLFDPESIPLMRFERARSRWKLW